MRLLRAVAAARRQSTDNRPFAPSRVLLLALLVGALGLGLVLGLRALIGSQPTASAGRSALPQIDSPLVVYSEFGQAADTLWAADPDDPTARAELAVIQHAWGYGILPSLSPSGDYIAYTVRAPDDSAAELWLLETASGVATRLADGIDLRIAPVWSPAGDALVVRRSTGQEGIGSSQLLRIDLEGTATALAADDGGLFPIDFSPDGSWLYYAVLSPSGTDLARASATGGEAETLAHLSNGVARDWQLSPDGTRLAYLAQSSTNTNVAFAAQVLELATGDVQTPLGQADVAQFSPVWAQSGGLTIGRLDRDTGTPLRLSADGTSLAVLPSAIAGFDVPLSWSPDGVHLAVRSFEGSSTAEPGPSRVVIVSTDGGRIQLSPQSDVVVAGWLETSE